ncbi:MAG: hypothetical protein IPK13_20780 [Deltaproteobacteria bacterium]|nr:hypothetical protein [Deltaproteobacteria bacterium]
MDRNIRRRIEAEKIKIERRLKSAIHVNEAGPVLSGGNVRYELAGKTKAISHGGIGAVQRLVKKTGLTKHIDDNLHLLKIKVPYHESDHVMNIAYNALCGGRTLEDIELRRNDRVFLEALGTRSIPDPTTAGDFCRRFSVGNTDGECKEGMDISYNGIWSCHALLVTLANTAEPLCIASRGANRPSHEGVIPYFERAGGEWLE